MYDNDNWVLILQGGRIYVQLLQLPANVTLISARIEHRESNVFKGYRNFPDTYQFTPASSSAALFHCRSRKKQRCLEYEANSKIESVFADRNKSNQNQKNVKVPNTNWSNYGISW